MNLATKADASADWQARCWQELQTHYSEKHRHYHNLDHLEYMFRLWEHHQQQWQDAAIVAFAIFYHDAIYNVKRKDNEEKSAELAAKRLNELGLSNDRIARCVQHILATKAHHLSEDPDTNLLVDIDLAILGDTPEVYRAYTQKVRKEYRIYPDLLYKPGRKKVLRHFLAMPRIYHTDILYHHREQAARQNLEAELAAL
ncbi:MAG: hypothetical protein AAGB22_14530 [Bacteroidota bacterium]